MCNSGNWNHAESNGSGPNQIGICVGAAIPKQTKKKLRRRTLEKNFICIFGSSDTIDIL